MSERQALETARDALTRLSRTVQSEARLALDFVGAALKRIEEAEAEKARAADPVLNDSSARKLIDDLRAVVEAAGNRMAETLHHPRNVHGFRLLAMNDDATVGVIHVPPGTRVHVARASNFAEEYFRTAIRALGTRRYAICALVDYPDHPIVFLLADAPFALVVAPRIDHDATTAPAHDGERTITQEASA